MAFRPKEALHKARLLEEQGDKSAAATRYAVLSVYYLRKKRASDALKMITRAMTMESSNSRLWALRSLCELAAGHSSAAEQWIEKFATRAVEKKEVEAFRQYLAKQSVGLEQPLKWFDGRVGQVPAPMKSTAREELKDLIHQLESELDLPQNKQSEDLEAQIADFRERSEKIVQGHAKTQLDLSLAFFEMGRLKEAKIELLSIEKNSELYFQARCLLGNVLVEMERNVEALGVLKDCLREVEPNDAIYKEALYQSVRVLLRLGDQKEASDRLEELRGLDSTYRDSQALRRELGERKTR